jgi:hypothetical protein
LLCGDIRSRVSVQLAVVALPQARVEEDRDAAAAESDLGGLDRSVEVGGVDEIDVSATLPQLSRLLAAAL